LKFILPVYLLFVDHVVVTDAGAGTKN